MRAHASRSVEAGVPPTGTARETVERRKPLLCRNATPTIRSVALLAKTGDTPRGHVCSRGVLLCCLCFAVARLRPGIGGWVSCCSRRRLAGPVVVLANRLSAPSDQQQRLLAAKAMTPQRPDHQRLGRAG